MQAVQVVSVIDPERRLDDRNIDAELDAHGVPDSEVCARINTESLGEWSVRKVARDVCHARLVQAQGAGLKNSIGSHVTEERHGHGTSDGDAVFDVAGSLIVAAGQGGGVHQDRKGERSQSAPRQRIVIKEGFLGHRGNENHGRDRTNIKSANIVFAAHIEAVEGGHFAAAVAGDIGSGEVQTDGIAVLADGVEIFDVENVGESFYIAA